MWSAGSDGGGVADVYVSERELALVRGADSLWHVEAGTLAEGFAALAARLGERDSPRRLRVWLGAALCRPVRMSRIDGARSRAERLRLTELAAVAQSGLEAPCRVSIDDAGEPDGAVATVVEEGVLTALEQALAPVRVDVTSIRPWWMEALAAALRSNPALQALGIWEGRALTILAGQGRTFTAAQTLHPVDSAESAWAAFARALVSTMVSRDDALAVCIDWSGSPDADQHTPVGTTAAFTPWIKPLGADS